MTAAAAAGLAATLDHDIAAADGDPLPLDLLLENLAGATVSAFAFRALSPLFDTPPLTVNGAPGDDGRVRLWTAGPATP